MEILSYPKLPKVHPKSEVRNWHCKSKCQSLTYIILQISVFRYNQLARVNVVDPVWYLRIRLDK